MPLIALEMCANEAPIDVIPSNLYSESSLELDMFSNLCLLVPPVIAEKAPDEDKVSPLRLSELNPRSVAQRMMDILSEDLALDTGAKKPVADMFDFDMQESRYIESLIWVFGIHPDGPGDLPFEWVCETLDLDIETMRRVIARERRDQLKATLRFLKPMSDPFVFRAMIERMQDYVNLDGWMYQ